MAYAEQWRTGNHGAGRNGHHLLIRIAVTDNDRGRQVVTGIQNRLTAQDIAEATIIIHSVAVTPEDNERFESRDVYEITLQDAIKNAAGIIKEIEEMIASEQQ